MAAAALLACLDAHPARASEPAQRPTASVEVPADDARATAEDAVPASARTGAAPVRGEQRPIDAARLPTGRHPPVVALPQAPAATRGRPKPAPASGLVGFTRALAEPRLHDPRRRVPATSRPAAFGHTLRPGEHFRYDVTFAGNPAGLAEAGVVALEPDPRGPPPAGAPRIRIEGHARTSGVVSILATVTDDIVTIVDAGTGAALSSENTLHYSGWAPRNYKLRVTEHAYEGRGQVRIVDTKDGEAQHKLLRAPLDTFDPMSAMAWVRSLTLAEGEVAKAHVIDGTTLMRLEIESQGRAKLSPLPSIAAALGLSPDDTVRIDGRITRVDAYDQPIPGKRVFTLRAWLSDDERKIPLVMESDMWVGAIRLEISAYDPPHETAPTRSATPAVGGAPARATEPSHASRGP